MKILLGIVALGLLFSGNANADNISDFQIDEMSIGDNALKYYSKSLIKRNKQKWYNSKEYSTSVIRGVNISYKTKDKNFTIVALEKVEGMDIEKCLERLPKEFDSIKDIFDSNIKIEGPIRSNHWADKSNKSWYEGYIFHLSNNDQISVECYNWSDEITSKKGWQDNLRHSVYTKEFNNFLNNQ
ncbi:hypothetical protein N9T29_02740 [Candidatus Pelagibacter sp.]|nr:hypothetical protein [Candidatus Pelagibacter sp.]